MHLSAEIAAAVFRIQEGGPSHLAARHRFGCTSLTAKGTAGARLVLQKTRREQEKEVEYYSELDGDEEDEEETSTARGEDGEAGQQHLCDNKQTK